MGMMMSGGMMAWMLLGGVLALAVLIALVMGIVWLARELVGGRAPHDRSPASVAASPTPAEILEQRYAAGEIDDVELHQRRANLSQ